MTVHLATGLAQIAGRVLLVASRYPNHAQPLWNLPGGRQHAGELLTETAAREVLEETGFAVTVGELAYISESYDGETYYMNACFHVEVGAAPSFDKRGMTEKLSVTDQTDHVVEVAWVPLEEIAQRIVVAVVREPLLQYLSGKLPRRYAGFHEAGITIEWPADSS